MTKIILPLIISLCPLASYAQNVQPTEINQNGKTIYNLDYFTRFTPENALDLVYNIPGFGIQEGENARGLAGTNGNILINGSRPGTKGTNIYDYLRNILLKDVIRVEVLEGASLEGQGQGYTKLVNIVKNEKTSASSSIELETSLSEGKPVTPFISYEKNNSYFGFNTRLSLKTGTEFIARRDGIECLKDANNKLIESGLTFMRPKSDYNQIGLNADGKIKGIKTNFNFKTFKHKFSRPWYFDAKNPIDNSNLRYDEGYDNSQEKGNEFSAQFETKLFDFTNETSIYIKTENSKNYAIAGFNTDRNNKEFSIYEEFGKTNEDVIQTNFSKSFGEHTLSFGGETGINKLDTNSYSSSLIKGIISINPNDYYKTKIEEKRSEVFIADNWKLSDKLSLETRLRNEWSTITQTGDDNKSRDFKYFKPSVTFNYNPVKNLNFVLGYEHKLGQLNFYDFAFSKNLNDKNQSQSTTELRPDQIDIFKFNIEKKWGQDGSLKLEISKNYFKDAIIRIPTYENGIITGETTGNLDEAENFEAYLEGFVPLDKLYNGLKFSFSYYYVKDDLLDPFTNGKREFDYNERPIYSLGISNYKDKANYNYGIDYNHGNIGKNYHLDSFYQWPAADEVSIFAEYKGFKSYKINARYYNPFGADNTRYKTVYKSGTMNSEIIQTQFRSRHSNPAINISIRKTL